MSAVDTVYEATRDGTLVTGLVTALYRDVPRLQGPEHETIVCEWASFETIAALLFAELDQEDAEASPDSEDWRALWESERLAAEYRSRLGLIPPAPSTALVPAQRPKNPSESGPYLKSPEWQARRRETLTRDGFQCLSCGARSNLHIHHLSYARYRHEHPDDLVTLCAGCHGAWHGKPA